jgi:hypothetical protein
MEQSRVLFEKLIVARMAKKVTAFYIIQSVISMFSDHSHLAFEVKTAWSSAYIFPHVSMVLKHRYIFTFILRKILNVINVLHFVELL